ncbi:hypothetical protein [Deinococcus humi]|uniref:Uncharacterized protein n=1 Tax=Deinococcus humi TaxID=662880 RepID=A0A7W8K031_9DEIO|nr:hypothetical protein [Deinococcus humi]MBB5366380.1 hypothetical protein [Deinococcus humi]GGO41512.1 hypothetical protein GCM10008949_52460 [Deinococcus humi]
MEDVHILSLDEIGKTIKDTEELLIASEALISLIDELRRELGILQNFTMKEKPIEPPLQS